MRRLALLGWICVSPALLAQPGSKTLVDDLVKHWQISKKLALAVAEAMPADAYRPFKPSDREWNFADEMGGLALNNALSCSLATHTKAPANFQSALDHPMDHSKAATLETLKAAYDYCIAGLTAMDDAGLFEIAPLAGHPATKFDIFWNAIAHATNQLGQAELFLQTKGLKPPETGPQYEF